MQNSHLKNSLIAAGIAVFAGVVTLGANVAFGVTNPAQAPAAAGLIGPTFSGLDVRGNIQNTSDDDTYDNTKPNYSAVPGAVRIIDDLFVRKSIWADDDLYATNITANGGSITSSGPLNARMTIVNPSVSGPIGNLNTPVTIDDDLEVWGSIFNSTTSNDGVVKINDDLTVTGATTVKDNGTVGTDAPVLSVHVDDQAPYLASFFNDTYSKTDAVFDYFAWNSGIFTMGTRLAKDFQLYTGGYSNTRLTIKGDTGNVGIGTTTPSTKLDVNGAIKATSLTLTGLGGAGTIIANASGVLSVGAAASSSLWTASGNNIYNANTGNVGIGTNNPSVGKVVSVSNVGNSPYLPSFTATTPGGAKTQKAAYSFYSTFDDGAATTDTSARRTADITAGFNGGAWGKEFLSFNVGGGSDASPVPTEKIRIQSDGKVGIGTTTPKSKLDIKGSDLVTGSLSGLTTPGLLSLNSLPYLLGGFLVQDSLNMDPNHIDAFGGKTLYINGKSEGNVSIGPDAGTNNNLQVNGKIYSTSGFGTYKVLSASKQSGVVPAADAGAGKVLAVSKSCGGLQLISCGVSGTGQLYGKDMIINKIAPSGDTCYAIGTTVDTGTSTLSVYATCWDSNN